MFILSLILSVLFTFILSRKNNELGLELDEIKTPNSLNDFTSCNTTDDLYKPQCIPLRAVHFPDPVDPIAGTEGDIDKFKNMTYVLQKDYLDYYYENLILTETNLTKSFSKRIFFFTLLFYLQRPYTDDIQYTQFRNYKKNYTELNVFYLTDLLTNKTYKDIFNTTVSEEEKILRGNAFFLLLFNMSCNFDGFNLNSTRDFYDILSHISYDIDEILSFFPSTAPGSETTVQQHLVFYFTISFDFLIDIFKFNEVDYLEVRKSIDNETNFINYPFFIQAANMLEEFSRIVAKYDYYSISNINIKYYIDNIKIKTFQSKRKFKDDDGSTDIQTAYPTKIFINKYNVAYVSYLKNYRNFILYSYKFRITHNITSCAIKMMDSKFDYVKIDKLKDNEKIAIEFTTKDTSDYYCYFRGENKFEHSGIVTDLVKKDQRKLRCLTTHLSDFTFGIKPIGGKVLTSTPNIFLWFLFIFSGIVLLGLAIFVAIKFTLFNKESNEEGGKKEDLVPTNLDEKQLQN